MKKETGTNECTRPYPHVHCEEHGIQDTGYAVCKHIQNPNDIGYYKQATNECYGVICCTECFPKIMSNEEKTIDNTLNTEFQLLCEACIKEFGLGQIQ